VRLDRAEALRRATAADHAVLGTVRAGTGPDLVPATFAIHEDLVGIAIDTVKPKTSTSLQRTRNLEANPHATLLVEQWHSADWSRLWWVRLRLERSEVGPEAIERLETALRERYPQYRDAHFSAILTFRITEVVGWAAAPDAASP
jgi:PPOX class probable F420-dependent enzyme